MNTISLKLPKTLEARLKETARRRGVSRSVVVREALSAYLEDGLRGGQPAVLDLAGELCGCLEGPGDLSCNKKRLDGFGR